MTARGCSTSMTAGEGDNPSRPVTSTRGLPEPGRSSMSRYPRQRLTYRNEPILILFLRDISERKQAEEVFLQSHRELEQLNEAKTKAVNHISHELKTPLAVIQGNVRVLRRRLEHESLDEKAGRMLAAIERSVERLFLMQREADEILRTSGEIGG